MIFAVFDPECSWSDPVQSYVCMFRFLYCVRVMDLRITWITEVYIWFWLVMLILKITLLGLCCCVFYFGYRYVCLLIVGIYDIYSVFMKSVWNEILVQRLEQNLTFSNMTSTNKQMNEQRHEQTNRQTNKKTDRYTIRQTDRQIDR